MRGAPASEAIAAPLPVIRVLWLGVALLVVVGIVAAAGRGIFRSDLATRADPMRQQLLDALHRTDPFLPQRPGELVRFDRRFALNPVATLMHVLPGGLFLILAPFQFSSRIRSRYIRFHRWSGRILVLTAVVAALAGLYFGLLMPYGGTAEVAAIVFFGGLFLLAVVRGFLAIRSRQMPRHREWMIRAFAIGIGISTVRIVSAALDFAFTPAGIRPPDLFALSLWIGWGVTLVGAEFWIRYTRAYGRSLALA